jgi:DNA-binding NtrC family response regulator
MKRKLLIVDNEDTILFAMQEYFSMLGYDVDCARHWTAAMGLLEGKSYAVVIADLRLTGSQTTEGFEIAEEVRKRGPSTPVILLTAYGSPQIEAEARTRGVHVLLHKPHPLPDIARIVLELCEREQYPARCAPIDETPTDAT